MSTISKEAKDEAASLITASGATIAAALQRHMDATARGEARAEARAEEKEALAWDRDQLLERVQELEARVEAAKQDAEQAITTSVAWMKIAEEWRHRHAAGYDDLTAMRLLLEKAEATIDAMGKEQAATLGELGAVWAGKLELITEIRDWNVDGIEAGLTGASELEGILTKHEPP